MEEMRHTNKKLTEMKTSRDAFGFLESKCTNTDLTIFEKKGVGIYKRQFHWAGAKEALPLHRLVEVDTVVGSDSWHMFYDTGHVCHILVREIACFSCEACTQMNWRSCRKLRMCGPTMSKPVVMKVANRVDAPLCRSAIVVEAKRIAKAVKHGDILGLECASAQEPFILLKAVSELYEYKGEDEDTWMGWIRARKMLIDAVKFEKYGNTDAFYALQEQKRFSVFEEDLRTNVVGYEAVEVRQSSRQTGAPAPMRIEVADAEISLLKERVMYDLNSIVKVRSRPRKSPTA
jgi:hypothetical protein